MQLNGGEVDEGAVLLTRFVSEEELVTMMEADDKTTSGGKKQVKSATHKVSEQFCGAMSLLRYNCCVLHVAV